MAYCTPTELRYYTGVVSTEYDDATLTALISFADMEIDAKLALYQIGGGGNSVKVASLKLATATLLTRMRMDGTKMRTLVLDKITMGDDIDSAIAGLRAEADALLTNYVKTNTSQKQSRRHLRILNRR